MTSAARRGFLAAMLAAGLPRGLHAESGGRRPVVRLHHPVVSEAVAADTLVPVAATPNIPVYEDGYGRRFLCGVDFSPFLHAWLQSFLTRAGLQAESPSLSPRVDEASPGLLLEIRDFRVDLTAAEVGYSGTLSFMPGNQAARRHRFKSLRVMFDCEEGRLEPHVLVSHDFDPLLGKIRKLVADDLAGQMAAIGSLLPRGPVARAAS